jgi:hypothetical protein
VSGTPGARECLDRLEALHADVLEAIGANDTARLGPLVLEQCRWARMLPAPVIPAEDRERWARLAEAAERQQVLVGQALRLAEEVARRLAPARRFSTFG